MVTILVWNTIPDRVRRLFSPAHLSRIDDVYEKASGYQ